MTSTGTVPMATYDLPLPAATAEAPRPAGPPEEKSALPEHLLLANAAWFCRLRFLVVGALAGFGIVGLVPEVSAALGWRTHPIWPFIAAGVLLGYNAAFLWHARGLRRSGRPGAAANLWGQVILDLLVLTGVVHFTGSLETPIPFAFLFHIALACIFLSRRQSLAVTLLASGLYGGCVALEVAGVIGHHGLYADPALREGLERIPGAPVFHALVTVSIFLVVWYLASHLAALVRQRDHQLAAANRRLVQAQADKARHMLRTTHELKAPFAAIHANTQLLLLGHCGALPDQALEVVRRIAARCRRLAHEIQEMLQLANLRSASEAGASPLLLDLKGVAEWAIAQVQPRAETRHIRIASHLEPARVWGVEEHLKMLLLNLLSNAVTYSHDGGRVRLTCVPAGRGGTAARGGGASAPGGAYATGAVVSVEDQGIGIHPEKLPHIFDEYYRTDEAVRHNPESTGLGLSIVRHVAETHGIAVRVTSQPGVGTTVTLGFQRPVPGAEPEKGPGTLTSAYPVPLPFQKERSHGPSDDH